MINKKVSFKKNIETVFVNRKNRNVTKNISFRCKIVLLNKIVLLMYTFIQSKIKEIQIIFGEKYYIIPYYYTSRYSVNKNYKSENYSCQITLVFHSITAANHFVVQPFRIKIKH